MNQITRSTGYITKRVLTLREAVHFVSPLSKSDVMLGLAVDGGPVLMNEKDIETANVIVWDRLIGQGLRLLKSAIEYIVRYKPRTSYATEFIIMSNNVEDWGALNENNMGVWNDNSCVAVVPFWDKVADDVLFALAGWCYGKRETNSPIFLFIDGIENVESMSEDSQNYLKYILEFGRKKNIYVVATAFSHSRNRIQDWLVGFGREAFGLDALHWFEMSLRDKDIVFIAPMTEM